MNYSLIKIKEKEFQLVHISKRNKSWDLRFEDFSLDKEDVLNEIETLNSK